MECSSSCSFLIKSFAALSSISSSNLVCHPFCGIKFEDLKAKFDTKDGDLYQFLDSCCPPVLIILIASERQGLDSLIGEIDGEMY